MRAKAFSFLRLIFISLLVWSQAASLSHVAVYGDEPHEHDGVICDVGIIASEVQAVLPPVPVQPYVPAIGAEHPEPVVTNAVWIWPPERGPPPRSPPVIQQ